MPSNLDFLKGVFVGVGRGETVFTCAVEGDPEHARYPYSADYQRDDHNNFFSVSTFATEPGKSIPRRMPKFFQALYCLVVDDVETKVDPRHVDKVLGLPTWTLETSPGNFQWGFALDRPVRDQSVAQGLVDALCSEFIGDMAGVNRLVRLPVGVNGKAKYGPTPFPTVLHSYDPTIRLSVETAIDALAATKASVADTAAAALPPDRDPTLQALYAAGLVKSDSGDGVYPITCPWVAEHTDGRDDGSSYVQGSAGLSWVVSHRD